jgi:uncharacterized protein YdcH (DUF465 family)
MEIKTMDEECKAEFKKRHEEIRQLRKEIATLKDEISSEISDDLLAASQI